MKTTRRITPEEVEAYRDAIKAKTGKKPRRRVGGPERAKTPAGPETRPDQTRTGPRSG
jgi:hypothetical protein